MLAYLVYIDNMTDKSMERVFDISFADKIYGLVFNNTEEGSESFDS